MRDKQYNQRLTPDKAAQGIKLAINNAKSLLSDAILLFENARYARAAALSILAIEEAGKPSILRDILLEDDPKQLKKAWQNYRRHTEKNTNWIVPELASKGANHIEHLRQTTDSNSGHQQELDNLKQLAFYTDAFSKCKWSSPEQVLDKELTEQLINTAKVLVGSDRDQNTMTTEEELKLWLKHLKPVWKKEMISMKQALINCYQEAEELNLIVKGTTERMIKFLL
jgi:AbiV family abortive infection protein